MYCITGEPIMKVLNEKETKNKKFKKLHFALYANYRYFNFT